MLHLCLRLNGYRGHGYRTPLFIVLGDLVLKQSTLRKSPYRFGLLSKLIIFYPLNENLNLFLLNTTLLFSIFILLSYSSRIASDFGSFASNGGATPWPRAPLSWAGAPLASGSSGWLRPAPRLPSVCWARLGGPHLGPWQNTTKYLHEFIHLLWIHVMIDKNGELIFGTKYLQLNN